MWPGSLKDRVIVKDFRVRLVFPQFERSEYEMVGIEKGAETSMMNEELLGQA